MYSLLTRHETPPLPSLPDYAFGERLGAGSYGTVYKARLTSSIPSRPSSATSLRPMSATAPPVFYAIKCIYRKALTKIMQDLLINEIKLLKQIKHENIVEMHDFRWDENYIYIIMEYCSGGDLSMFIRSKQKLSETSVRFFLKQIAKALKFLYEKQISHMDLKPANILLKSVEKPTLKVADFGVAQHIDKQGSRSVRGTLMYMAPEVLSLTPYDNRVDLWSIGVILYECLFGKPPFSFITTDDLIETIKSNTPIEIPIDTKISPDCRHLLEGLLQRDPNKRISFREFFEHPFIHDNLVARIAHAEELLQRATIAEQSEDLKSALDQRLEALDEYLAMLKIDVDTDRRRSLRTKVKQEVTHAEILKKRLREASGHPDLISSSVTSSISLSPSLMPSPELDPNSDQELLQAYQHLLNGDQLMKVFIFAKALEEYEIGLNTMFPFLKKETDPQKSEILRKMISNYLTKAEKCKERSEAQRWDLALEKIKEDSAVENTMIDEINPIHEKKTTFNSVPQCPLQ